MSGALWPFEKDDGQGPSGPSLAPLSAFDGGSSIVTHDSYRGVGDGSAIIRWAGEKLGIPEHTLRWSVNPGYYDENGAALHQWDGTPDPVVALFAAIERGENVADESGTGTGKSFAMAIAVLWFLACWKDGEVYTFAPTEDQLKLYIWKNIQDLWPRFSAHFPKAELTTLTIRMYGGTNEKWSAHGFPVQIRAGEKVSVRASGMHAKDMMLVYEEMPGMDISVLEAGRNTCTAPHNFRVGIGNPTHQFDALHKMAEEVGTVAIRMSGLDHPNVVSGNADIVPGAVSRKSIADREAKYGVTDPIYLARVRGFSPEQAANALIRLEWLKASAERYRAKLAAGFDPRVAPVTGKGVDAANSEHGDSAAIVDFSDNTLIRCDAFPCPDSNKLGAQVVRECVKDGTPEDRVGVDAIGVGAGTVNEARRQHFNVWALYAGGKPMPMVERLPDGDTKEWTSDVNKFLNLRAQMGWQARVDLQGGVIDVPEDDELWEELMALTFDDDGKVTKLCPKDLVKKQIGRSPNKGDAFLMANWVRSRAIELSAPAPKEGQSLGYDYAKHKERERESGEAYYARLLGAAHSDPLANRYHLPMRDVA